MSTVERKRMPDWASIKQQDRATWSYILWTFISAATRIQFKCQVALFDRLISIDTRRQVRISKENCSCDRPCASHRHAEGLPRCASTEGSGRQLSRSANPTIPSPYDLAHLITFNIDEPRICFSISTHPWKRSICDKLPQRSPSDTSKMCFGFATKLDEWLNGNVPVSSLEASVYYFISLLLHR